MAGACLRQSLKSEGLCEFVYLPATSGIRNTNLLCDGTKCDSRSTLGAPHDAMGSNLRDVKR